MRWMIARPRAAHSSGLRRLGDQSDSIISPYSVAFVLIHAGCFLGFWTGLSVPALVLGLALYVIRMFAIGAGYHRYFAHRTFRTGRAFQFVLALLALTSAQRGVLWWAAKHRQHHRHADTEADLHSPVLRGFLYAHIGWIFLSRNDATDYRSVRDLAQCGELVWLERHSYLPVAALALLTWLIAGWPGLAIGFCWSTVAVWHVTFSINSLSHLIGRQPYVTGDQSRNNWLLALLTMGEGWHNNHHAYQASVRQGFRWWQFDPTFYLLRVLSWFGLVWDLHVPPGAVVRGEHRLGRRVIAKVADRLAASYPIYCVADQTTGDPTCAPRLTRAHHLPPGAFGTEIDPEQMPRYDEVRRYASARLAPTPSMDEIASATMQRLLTRSSSACIQPSRSPAARQRVQQVCAGESFPCPVADRQGLQSS
jgi:stearoyl-CoA desaturase (delta-9 desaturase)